MTSFRLTACLSLLMSVSALAASMPPPPRLARSLPQERSAAVAVRARHNAALKAFLAASSLPQGGGLSNVLARAEALERIASSMTNAVGGTSSDPACAVWQSRAGASEREKQALLDDLRAVTAKPTRKSLEAIISKHSNKE